MNNFIAHILVVDDDDGIRSLIKKYLNEKNFLVTTSDSAENATKKVSIIKFDLIVLDVMMSGKSGLDFIKENTPDVFFIYSTKSAKNLFNLINKYSLLNVVTHSNLMCISEKAFLVLKQIKWKKVFIFSPGEEEFILNKIK